MLVTDHSGSMAATDVAPTRLAAATAAADTFIDKLPGDGARRRGGVLDLARRRPGAGDRPRPRRARHRQRRPPTARPTPATRSSSRCSCCRAPTSQHPPSAIVLLSDGAANAGADPVTVASRPRTTTSRSTPSRSARPSGVLPDARPVPAPSPVPPDPALMHQIAQTSGGRTFTAQSADQLSSIYDGLGQGARHRSPASARSRGSSRSPPRGAAGASRRCRAEPNRHSRYRPRVAAPGRRVGGEQRRQRHRVQAACLQHREDGGQRRIVCRGSRA